MLSRQVSSVGVDRLSTPGIRNLGGNSVKHFEGKTAVVTGAASGIGFGLAERFAQESMQVVMADVEEEALERR
ncbi:MAG: hypothetical protein CM1200mP9_09230 [Gammaproteobacteria bacterium]|nr:MAG: hypothetical protein CM1200mP9_09230 [Gammaproteobacteria bacterium]